MGDANGWWYLEVASLKGKIIFLFIQQKLFNVIT